jgi:hypothetical protein
MSNGISYWSKAPTRCGISNFYLLPNPEPKHAQKRSDRLYKDPRSLYRVESSQHTYPFRRKNNQINLPETPNQLFSNSIVRPNVNPPPILTLAPLITLKDLIVVHPLAWSRPITANRCLTILPLKLEPHIRAAFCVLGGVFSKDAVEAIVSDTNSWSALPRRPVGSQHADILAVGQRKTHGFRIFGDAGIVGVVVFVAV